MPSTSTILIGGGIIGLACAWRLAQAGQQVQLLEARHCGQGATLAALGALWPPSPLANGPLQQLHRASLWEFEAFVTELQQASATRIRFQRRGRLELLTTAKAVTRAAEEAAAACRDWPALAGTLPIMELIEPAQVAAEFPHIAAQGRAALRCRTTAQVNVSDLVAALKAACSNAGVQIHEATAVTGIQKEGNRITGISTRDRLFPAHTVLLTAGAWSGIISPDIARVAPIRPAKGQGIALAMPVGLQLDTILKSDTVYLVPWHERDTAEILVGSTTEPEAGFDETPTDAARAFLFAGAAALVRALKDVPMLRHWAGLRPQNTAKRHPPIMGVHPEIQNLYICTGHFKTGIGFSPRVSRLMAEAITTKVIPPELAAFAPGIP